MSTLRSDTLNRVDNQPGYTTPVFKGKDEQRTLVEHDVAAKVSCSMPSMRTANTVSRALFPANSSLARSIGSTQTLASTTRTSRANPARSFRTILLPSSRRRSWPTPSTIQASSSSISSASTSTAMARPLSTPAHQVSPQPKALAQYARRGKHYLIDAWGPSQCQARRSPCTFRIDELFLNNSTPENAYRLETFRSTGAISATASQQLRCYFVTKCNFPNQAPTVAPGQKTDIRTVSDSSFLEKVTTNTLDIYQNVRAFALLLTLTRLTRRRSCGMSNRVMAPSSRSLRSRARASDASSSDTRWAARPTSSGASSRVGCMWRC